MTDSTVSVNNYANQMLISSLFGSSSTSSSTSSIDDLISDYVSVSDNSTYGDTIQDYAEVTQDAIDAYQDEVNKGTTYNAALQSMSVAYNYFINNSSSNSNGISASIILSSCQAKNLLAIDLSKILDKSSSSITSTSSDSTTSETTSS